jgi:hypothetical protein
MTTNKEELKNAILEENKKGNIVISTGFNLAVCNLDQFVEQPTDGMLYDLNRLPEVVFTFLDDPKWVNDYAVAMVISKLKQKIAMLESNKSTASSVTCSGETSVEKTPIESDDVVEILYKLIEKYDGHHLKQAVKDNIHKSEPFKELVSFVNKHYCERYSFGPGRMINEEQEKK